MSGFMPPGPSRTNKPPLTAAVASDHARYNILNISNAEMNTVQGSAYPSQFAHMSDLPHVHTGNLLQYMPLGGAHKTV